MVRYPHTIYNCEYYILFLPQSDKRKVYMNLRKNIGMILRRLCEYKGVEIISAYASIDYIYMQVRIPPKLSVSKFMGYLKGKSAIMLFEKYASINTKNSQRTFWMRGYCVSTKVLTKEVIREYVNNQKMNDRTMKI